MYPIWFSGNCEIRYLNNLFEHFALKIFVCNICIINSLLVQIRSSIFFYKIELILV